MALEVSAKDIGDLIRRVRVLETGEQNDSGWIAMAGSYGTGWSDFGGGYEAGSYRKLDDIVFVRGLIQRTSGTNRDFFTLPAGFRPANRTRHVAHDTTAHISIDILSTGIMRVATGGTYTNLSLWNIRFSIL